MGNFDVDKAMQTLVEHGFIDKDGHPINISSDAISRTRAMETFAHWAEHKDYTHVERHILHAVVDELRAMPSINEQDDEWTPILKDLYDGMAEGGK